MGLYRDQPRFIITRSHNQLLLLCWLVKRWSRTSWSILFNAATSIPKAAATLDMFSPKDLRSSRKSISSPVLGLCSLGQERLHCGQLHKSTCRGLHFFSSGDLEDVPMLLGASRRWCSREKCAESCSKERTGEEEEESLLPSRLLDVTILCLRLFSSFFALLLSSLLTCLLSSLLNLCPPLLTLLCLFRRLLRRRCCFCPWMLRSRSRLLLSTSPRLRPDFSRLLLISFSSLAHRILSSRVSPWWQRRLFLFRRFLFRLFVLL